MQTLDKEQLTASKNLGKSRTPKPTHNRGSLYDFLHPSQDGILTALMRACKRLFIRHI